MAWVRARLRKLQKGCTRLATARDKAYQLLAHGRWFSPASSTTKPNRHDMAEILVKVALNSHPGPISGRENTRRTGCFFNNLNGELGKLLRIVKSGTAKYCCDKRKRKPKRQRKRVLFPTSNILIGYFLDYESENYIPEHKHECW
jgi:hypothetical protein